MSENDPKINYLNFQDDIRKIRDEHKKAKRILNNIKDFESTLDNLSSRLKNKESRVDITVEEIKSLHDSVDDIKSKSENRLNQIEEDLVKVKSNIDEMQTAYDNFLVIKGKMDGTSGEIETLLKNANGLVVDIEKAKKDALSTLDEIRKLLGGVQNNIEEMKNAYNEFISIRGKINDKNNGFQAVLNKIQESQGLADKLYSEIKAFRDESKNFRDDIEKNFKETEDLKLKISTNLAKTNENKKEVEKITNLIVDTGFANSFKERERVLGKASNKWLIILLSSVVLMVIYFIYVFIIRADFEGIPGPGIVFYRVSLSSPLWFLIGFAVREYSRERNLNEKYAFKASVTAVFRNHINYLIDKFTNDKEPESTLEISKFAAETMRVIYKEPYEGDKEVKEKVRSLEKLIKNENKSSGNNGTKIKDVVDFVKKLKDLIPDEKLLEKVINLFVKN